MTALQDPRLHELLKGFLQHRLQTAPQLILIQGCILHGQHIGIPGKSRNPDIILQRKRLGHLLQIPEILPGQLAVVFQGSGSEGIILISDVQIHLSPGHIFLCQIPDASLKHVQLPRHLDPQVQIPVIDRFQFHGDPAFLSDMLGSSIAGHALDHSVFLQKDTSLHTDFIIVHSSGHVKLFFYVNHQSSEKTQKAQKEIKSKYTSSYYPNSFRPAADQKTDDCSPRTRDYVLADVQLFDGLLTSVVRRRTTLVSYSCEQQKSESQEKDGHAKHSPVSWGCGHRPKIKQKGLSSSPFCIVHNE